MMKKLLIALALTVGAAQSGAAQNVLISGSGNLGAPNAALQGFTTGLLNWSFVVPASPIGPSSGPTLFALTVTTTFVQGANSATKTTTLNAFTSAAGGGFILNDPSSFAKLLDIGSSQIFSLPTTAPAFLLGTYTGSIAQRGPAPVVSAGNFTISSASVVPEPSTFGLLCAGLMALGAAARARRPRRRA